MISRLGDAQYSRLALLQLGQLDAAAAPAAPVSSTELGTFELGTIELPGPTSLVPATDVATLGLFELGTVELLGAAPPPPVVTSINAYVSGAVPQNVYSFVY